MGKGRGENNKRKGCGTCGKCCICLIATFVVLAVAIALTVYFLWPRPPKIEFKGVLPPEDPSKQLVLNNLADFTANQRLNITVDNPNYIGVVLSKITMEGTLDTVDNYTIATGELENQGISKTAKTNILFPIQIHYNPLADKDLKALKYIADKCGMLENKQRTQLKINYKLDISVKVVAINVSIPTIHESTMIDCPFPQGQSIPGLDVLLKAQQSGGNMDIGSLINSIKNQLPPGVDASTISDMVNNLSKSGILNGIKF
ncbi:hypothetical protein CONCODRAFT_3632 [Conidiobolus coronatus NRRL 28638]|uniref:Late embryogenesis abundant protein LEA-2 subgroup domain-containing protein n=1 Tax=Conidiobolus coronatus (strain ATCC 28846 / CBS 209.66 / NRRL 28638) TaxID=796925 RepID=A0A137PEI5_CONC2|nr:hypothetical protein CONCODRAFT_3632 [Conidiobolus coronatus NRRL 28638]|eukprot:KXN73400.1 hypothetical protein CONCODRAFT_3632 [Conidiobolus coronatus NRRL 28638]